MIPLFWFGIFGAFVAAVVERRSVAKPPRKELMGRNQVMREILRKADKV